MAFYHNAIEYGAVQLVISEEDAHVVEARVLQCLCVCVYCLSLNRERERE